VCEDAACAEATYGTAVAHALIARLADLRAASHPLEPPFSNAQPESDGEPERVTVSLADNRSLVIVANPAATPRTSAGGVAWQHVNRVIVLRLE
jgi:hypothetical protein